MVRPVMQPPGLVLTSDGDIKQCLDDPELGREQPVHRRGRDIGLLADGLDRRCGVAAFEEQDPGGLDDRFAGQAGPRLAALALVGASPLDTGRHARETTTLKLRVLLSTLRGPRRGGSRWRPPRARSAQALPRPAENGLGRLAAWCYDHRRRVLADSPKRSESRQRAFAWRSHIHRSSVVIQT